MMGVDLPADLGHPKDPGKVGAIVGAVVGAAALAGCLAGIGYVLLAL
jgi:hypothetical protein